MTRDRILLAALRLFAERGYAQTTMADIGRAAGITDAAIYRHFPSKEALAATLFHDRWARLAAYIDGLARDRTDFAARVRAVIEGLAQAYDTDPHGFRFVLITGHIHAPTVESRSPFDALGEIVAAGIADGACGIADADLALAVLLGPLVQAASFAVHTTRMPGPLGARGPALADATLRALKKG